MDRKIAALVLPSLVALGTLAAAGSAQAATPTFYTDLATFQSDITVTVTDDYSDPGYVFIQDDIAMSGVLGETDYMTTGFNNLNIVNGGYYCAGCNGSFELSFLTTSVGVATGVHGVGAYIQTHNLGVPYYAYITFADGTSLDIALPAAGNFWGVAAPERIERIHFGLSMGGATTNGSFGIDDLIVGSGNVGGCEVDSDCFDLGDPCTDPVCVDELCAYEFNTAPCDDGNICTEDDVCFEGVCDGAPVDCSDDNECTNEFCDPESGCVLQLNVEPCDDGSVCTQMDTCNMGVCDGTPIDCGDDDVCTADSCDPEMGCYSEPIRGCCESDEECGPDEICDLGTNMCVPEPSGGTGTGGGTDGDTGAGGTAAGEDTGLEDSGTPADTGAGETGGGTGVGETGDGDSGTTASGATEGNDDSPTTDDVPVADPAGCGCTTTDTDPERRLGWLLLGVVGLIGRRRRRRRAA
ncbi:MAG: MYXO-CTERM sorting domain-containing protein [Myxococcota bacterium]